jgi:hypothetical protein
MQHMSRAGSRAATPPERLQPDGRLDGRRLNLTHLHKVFWPEEGYTKQDLIDIIVGYPPSSSPSERPAVDAQALS